MIQGVINAFVPLAEAWMEHAGQKDVSLAEKYLKTALKSVNSMASPPSNGMGMFAASAAAS
jgi:hypothetical protein